MLQDFFPVVNSKAKLKCLTFPEKYVRQRVWHAGTAAAVLFFL